MKTYNKFPQAYYKLTTGFLQIYYKYNTSIYYKLTTDLLHSGLLLKYTHTHRHTRNGGDSVKNVIDDSIDVTSTSNNNIINNTNNEGDCNKNNKTNKQDHRAIL